MAIPANPVSVGNRTRKSDYDVLYDNAILADTGGTAGGAQTIPGAKTFSGNTLSLTSTGANATLTVNADTDKDPIILLRSSAVHGRLHADVSDGYLYLSTYQPGVSAYRTLIRAGYVAPATPGDVIYAAGTANNSYMQFDNATPYWRWVIAGAEYFRVQATKAELQTKLILAGGAAGDLRLDGPNEDDRLYFDHSASLWALVIASSNYLTVDTTRTIASSFRVNDLSASGDVQADAQGDLVLASDETMKENIQGFDKGLKALMQLEPISWDWTKDSGHRGKGVVGFGAQRTFKPLPEAVTINHKSWIFGMNHKAIQGVLVNSVKELAVRIKKIEERV